jgi:hypothetical protein
MHRSIDSQVDDASPLIVYQGNWGDSSHVDTYWQDYANGTFHATNGQVSQIFDGISLSYHVSSREIPHLSFSTELVFGSSALSDLTMVSIQSMWMGNFS